MDEFDDTLSKVRPLVKHHSIIGTDYRSVVHPHELEKLVTHDELVSHFFSMDPLNEIIFIQIMMRFRETLEVREIAFRFYMAIPFTNYELDYVNAVPRPLWSRSLTNQRAKLLLESNASVSFATNNRLTTALVNDIDFFQESEEIPDSFFEETLQKILEKAKSIWNEGFEAAEKLKIDPTNAEFESAHTRGDNLYFSIIRLGFFETRESLNPTDPENRYHLLLNWQLLKPLAFFINGLLGEKFIVASYNPNGTGYDAKLPNQTDSVQLAFSDICVYRDPPECFSVLVVEVKKFPLMNFFAQSYPKQDSKALASFHLQLMIQMLTNGINRGILSDAENAILIKIDNKKLKQLRDAKKEEVERVQHKRRKQTRNEDVKIIPLQYKLLNSHSVGVTLRGGILAFLYECMSLSKEDRAVIAEEMDDLFNYLKLTDEDFLKKMDDLSNKEITELMELLRNTLPDENIECLHQEISSFEHSDIQTGFKFNTQVFKVLGKDLDTLVERISNSQVRVSMKSEGVIVAKVFDPLKCKSRSFGKPYNKNEVRLHCIKSYMQERAVYNRLQDTDFNSCYIRDQPITFFKFLINGYYHALGPCIFLRYVNHQLEEFPSHDFHYFFLAQEQLKILHSAGISHNDLRRRNVLCTQSPDGTRHVYLIDFGYSSMQKFVGQEDFSEPVTERSLIHQQEADIDDLGSVFYGCTSFETTTDENESSGHS